MNPSKFSRRRSGTAGLSVRVVVATLCFALSVIASVPVVAADQPNIVWMMAEDMCPDLSCYGVKAIKTPVLDKLAAEGARYTRAFTTSPVCSTARSAMMTGVHQNYIGAHQHRTSRKKPLPHGVRTIVDLMREAGYYTILGGLGGGKTDLNFTVPKDRFFHSRKWQDRPKDKPFFIQLSFGNTHRSWGRDPNRPIDGKDVVVPPYYPDTPLVRRDIANGLEEIQKMDRSVGKVVATLKKEGVLDNTLLIFIGDHGRCQVRGKQFLYDSGLQIPLIIRWPKHIKPGTVSDDLVSSIDISAAILAAAGVKLPEALHGRDFLDPATPSRKYIFAARDKMDSTHDAMRAIRSKKFKYILNLMPERAYCQLNEYKEKQYPVLALLNVLNMKDELNDVQKQFMAAKKPEEELFDLEKDPFEIHNLAKDPAYAEIKKQLRADLEVWRTKIKDQGVSESFRKGGWSSKYPTRSLEQWEQKLKGWEARMLKGDGAQSSGKPKKKKDRKKKKAS